EVWSWCGLMVSLLLWFIHCSCCQVSAVRMTLHHRMRWLLSLLLRSLDVHVVDQRWIQFVMSGRWRSNLDTAEVVGHIVSVWACADDRRTRSQDRGKVLVLCPASSSQIRDGPLRRRHRRRELRLLEDREAA